MPTSLLNPLLQLFFSYFVYLQTICACPRCGNAHILAQPLLAIIFLFSSFGYLCLTTMWQCPHPCSTPSCNYFSFFFFWPFVPAHNAHILAQPPFAIIFFLFCLSSAH